MKVYCNEQLTPKKQGILREARQAKKFFIWTSKGDVYCHKKLDGSQVIEVKDLITARYLVNTQRGREEADSNKQPACTAEMGGSQCHECNRLGCKGKWRS